MGSRPSDPCNLGLYRSATVAHNLFLNTRHRYELSGGTVADARDFSRKTCAMVAEAGLTHVIRHLKAALGRGTSSYRGRR